MYRDDTVTRTLTTNCCQTQSYRGARITQTHVTVVMATSAQQQQQHSRADVVWPRLPQSLA